jgi:outer membrane receptor protein involved in Fe transport
MKKILLLFCILLTAVPAQSQQTKTYTLKGTVVDSLSSLPESYATVCLMRENGGQRPASMGLTDSTGVFRLTVHGSGRYQLTVSSIGRKPLLRSVTIGPATTQDLGTLRMGTDANMLGTATVKAQRPIVKAEIDKLSYAVADDPDAQTNSLLEMLRKVPMVTVDGDDNIKVNGNASFKVYVNGKPNQMMSSNPSQILKNYPASAVKKIEVITNPGAKYDAEGVSGVLNIVTNVNTSMNGYTLTPSLKMENTSVIGSVFGMVQLGKLTVSGHYGLGHYRQPTSNGSMEREIFADATNHLLTDDNRSKNKGTFQFGSLDASYEFSKKDLLSVSAGLHAWSPRGDTYHDQTMHDMGGNKVYSYLMHSHEHGSHPGINASADYQHTFTEGRTLTLSYRLDASPEHEKNFNTYSDITATSLTLNDIRYDKKNRSYEHTGQLDFTTPLGKDHKLSTGLKYIYRLNRSDNKEFSRPSATEDEYAIDDAASLRYRHRGDISAAYVEYNYHHKALSAMAGARYEYYHINVTYPDGRRDPFKADIGDLVPSASIACNLSETKMLRLGYNMRIARPDINALSPYVTQISPEAVSYGNPNLKSARAHNIELGFSTFSAKFNLNTTLTYNFSNNGLTSYSFVDGGIVHTTYDNFLHEKNLNLGMFLNWTVFSGTSLNVNAQGGYNDLRVSETGDHNYGFSAGCFAGISQKLPARLKADLWMGGGTRDVQLQGRGTSFYMYRLGLSRSFLAEDRLQLSIGASNFFNPHRTFKRSTSTDAFRSSSTARINFFRLGVGITYRLGSLKASVKKAARTIENTDVETQQNGTGGQSSEMGGQQQ